MAKTLQQILGARVLCGVIQGIKRGIPFTLPPEFLSLTTPITGDTGSYDMVEGGRKLARQAAYGSRSRGRSLSGVKEVPVKLIHTPESHDHIASTLMNLREIGSDTRQAKGIREVERQLGEFNDLFDNLRKACLYSMIARGAIYFDGDGELYTTSQSTGFMVDFQVPAGNKDQCNMLAAGNIITASWGTAGTDIETQIQALKRASIQLTGYPLTDAYYGKNIYGYLRGNTNLSGIIMRNPDYQRAFTNNTIPSPFMGLNWHDCSDSFYVNESDTITELFGGDTVALTPPVGRDVYELLEGSVLVPSDINLSRDAAEAVNKLMEINGKASYATITTDPVGIHHVGLDTFLPVWKVPKALVIADVTP